MRAAFDAAATTYDRSARLQREVALRLETLAAERLARPPARIVELGCGTGFLTEALHARWPAAELFAQDLAPAMIAHAREKLGAAKRISWSVGDAEHFTPDAPPDLLASSLTFQWFDDPCAALVHHALQSRSLAVALLVEGTFAEWIAGYRALGIEPRTLPFPKHEAIEAALQRASLERFEIIVERRVEGFPTPAAFVRSLRAIGAHAPESQHAPLSLQRLTRAFPEGVSVTYAIAYVLTDSAL